MWLEVIVQPESSFSIVRVTFVLMLSGVRFAPPSCAESAIEKQAACAAAINSSGFVPGPFSNREVNEYCVSFSTPPGAEIVPLPSFSPPFHTAPPPTARRRRPQVQTRLLPPLPARLRSPQRISLPVHKSSCFHRPFCARMHLH